MNWKKYFFYLTILAGSLSACDSFQDDVAPTGEEELVLKDAISALQNTSLFIDLKTVIQSSEVVKFSIGDQPQKGTASINDQAILQYNPQSEFQTGQDFLSINLLDRNGNTIDTDGIYINMASSADSLPCLNGALTDYYNTIVNESVILTPLDNDGYCADETSGAVLDFTEDPKHGTIEQIELFTYRYTPNADFEGKDDFMYELTLIDNEGEEHYSLAQVNVTISQDSTSNTPCDSLIQPMSVEIEDWGDWGGGWPDSYLIELFYLDPLICGSQDYQVSIDDVLFGSVELIPGYHNMIYYTPGDSATDLISYSVTFADGHEVSSYVDIDMIPLDSICGAAHDDYYELMIVADSTGTQTDPYYLTPSDNDDICGDWDIKIITDPSIGSASVSNSHQIEYFVSEEFLGKKETEMLYEICDGVKCDTALIQLSIERF
ncbi:MAG: hypothetical protein CMB89_04395 [Flammeovirgaceae bacterium]|nr:hypothetical protein [Flammeovirgaceae bacterium]